MILKFIVFTLVGLVAYKFITGRLPFLTNSNNKKLNQDDEKKIEDDTLIECDKCGTFVTYKESIIVKGKVYCSKECAGF
ncbi:hypothetical protein MNB_SV-9-1372 [hydrothermal vent metagenome]|uniref:Prokaryotic metallothionein n=1 Tax=hydrothermal vent metagenome TaxID=652676 RepID=A0A1W1BE93_9ZZZZ